MKFEIEAGYRSMQIDNPEGGYWYDEVVCHREEINIRDREDIRKDEVLVGGYLHETLTIGMNKANGWLKQKQNALDSIWGKKVNAGLVQGAWLDKPLLNGKVTEEIFRYWYEGADRIYYLKLSWELSKITIKRNQRGAMERLPKIKGSVDELLDAIKVHGDAFPESEAELRDQQIWDRLTTSQQVTLNSLINFSWCWTPDRIDVDEG